MTKKISLLLAIIMAFCSCIALSSCGSTPEETNDGDNTTYVFDYHISDDGEYYIVTGYGITTESVSIIPEEYDGKPVKEIFHEAFSRDHSKEYIKEMTLASTIEKIGFSAFYECENLKTLNFNVGLKTIEDNAFGKCPALTEAKLPEGLESIGNYAFRSCTALSSVTLPSTITHIGTSAFAETKYLNEKAPVHNGNIIYIPDTAGMTWVILAEYDITDANLPDNAIGIASGAFASCDMLTTVEIPAGVKYISKNAFFGCTSLTTVNFGGSSEDFAKIVIEEGNDALLNATINFAK